MSKLQQWRGWQYKYRPQFPPAVSLGERVTVVYQSLVKGTPKRTWTGSVDGIYRDIQHCEGRVFATYFYSVQYDKPGKYGEHVKPPEYIWQHSSSRIATMQRLTPSKSLTYRGYR